MKTILYTLLFFITGIFCLENNQAQAQTGVKIRLAADSSYWGCRAAPSTSYFVVYYSDSGYVAPDSVELQVFFGDGQDTVIKEPVNLLKYLTLFRFNHTYTLPGSYVPKYVLRGPDGKADSAISQDVTAIGVACGDISGKVYKDNNGNCTQDNGEPELGGIYIGLYLNNQLAQVTSTNGNGEYFFSATSGFNYTVKPYDPSSLGYIPCPANGHSVSSFPATGKDFGFECAPDIDLWSYMYISGTRPGTNSITFLNYGNRKCLGASGTLYLSLDPLLSYTSATTPPTAVNGNLLSWDFTDLTNDSGQQFILVYAFVSTSATVGDSLCNSDSISILGLETNPADNKGTSCEPVRNSYDPNIKEVSPAGKGAAGKIDPNTTFTYTIHFQNTGNDEAYNIFILDTLDSDLDLESFQVLGYSHPMQLHLLPGRILKFSFDNIMLPDSTSNEPESHGFVSYRIKTKNGLGNGTELRNTAHIFFDYNPAIVTNTTLNTVDILQSVKEEAALQYLQVIPNPASESVTVNSLHGAAFSEIVLMDMTGRILVREKMTDATASLRVAALPAGIYLLQATGGKHNLPQRLVVVH